MTRVLRLLNLGCAVVGLMALTACFDIEERTAIAADGQTTLEVTVRLGMPDGKSTGQLKKLQAEMTALQKQPATLGNVTLSHPRAEHRDGALRIGATFTARALADVRALFVDKGSPFAAFSAQLGGDSAGTPPIALRDSYFDCRTKSGGQRCERTIRPEKSAKPKPKKSADPLGMGDMSDMLFAGVFVRYALTLPQPIVKSNAEFVTGNTAVWVVPLAHLNRTAVTFWAESAD